MLSLTIAIPTFNRSSRLKKTLNDLLINIINSKHSKKISIFVSNNGSTDNTEQVINEYQKYYISYNLKFTFDNLQTNSGFDNNVYNCYLRATSDYVWIISDDDNLYFNSIDQLFNDIEEFKPNLIYYNFYQPPNDFNKPLIELSEFSNNLNEKTFISINKLINFPKLTALVFRRDTEIIENIKQFLQFNGFMHIGIALEKILSKGDVLFSNFFIAKPDSDYFDHIDFVPYVGNNLIELVRFIFHHHKLYDYETLLKLKYTDPFYTSIEWIYLFYIGKMKLTNELKNTLLNTIYREFKITKLNYKILILFLKFIPAYIHHNIYKKLSKK